MKTIQAIDDKVVAEEISSEEIQTSGGIIIPTNVKMEPQKYGKVISVGEKIETIKADDIIVFHPAGGQVMMLNGIIMRVLMYNEIYGVLKE